MKLTNQEKADRLKLLLMNEKVDLKTEIAIVSAIKMFEGRARVDKQRDNKTNERMGAC